MRNPIRLLGIVLLSLASISTNAQKILVAGVKHLSSCEFATRPLLADLKGTPFPADWTIVVACNQVVWEEIKQKADALRTETAFTNLQKRITVINGGIYRATLPLLGVHKSPQLVLRHEAGHIICVCNDEEAADRAAGIP